MTDEAKPAAKAEPGKRYTALTPIEHDGKSFGVGKSITLTDDDARPLLDCRPPAIEPAGKKAAEPTE